MRMIGLLFMVFCAVQAASAAGFDCDKASTRQEKLICSTPELSMLDDELSDRFARLNEGKTFQLMQRAWLRNVRNRCTDVKCLTSVYNERIQYLTAEKSEILITQSMILEQTQLRSDGYEVAIREEDAWPRYTLFNSDTEILLLDATVIDNVLYAILAVDEDKTYTLYEYADNRDSLYPIIHSDGLQLSRDFNTFYNVIFERYSGIEEDTFYFRVKVTDELSQALSYKLGSETSPVAVDRIYQSKSLAERYARARIGEEINTGIDELILRYDGGRTENVTIRTGFNYQNWIISHPVWHATKPVLYFDNSGAYACIWRVDLWHKTLTKIVPEHEAETPLPVTLNGKEAVVYIEEKQLKIAVSP